MEGRKCNYHTSEFLLDKLKKYPFCYSELINIGSEDFPHISPDSCTEDCKIKMKNIIEFDLSMRKKFLLNYFDDCKIVHNRPERSYCTPPGYFYSLNRNVLPGDVKENMNIGFVNGKVVRLCDNSNDFTPQKIEEAFNKFMEEKNNKKK